MRLPAQRWIGHVALLGVLAAACTLARQPGSAPVSREDTSPETTLSSITPLDATPVVEAPATLTEAAQAYRPAPAAPPSAGAPASSSLASWVESLRPTGLFAGPTNAALRFTELPPQSYLRVLESHLGWLLVVYSGDSNGRQPGNAWVQASDVAPPSRPPQWAKNFRVTRLWSGPDDSAVSFATLPQWSWLELAGQEQGGRLLVRYPGDGRSRAPGQAWIDGADIGPSQPPSENELPRAYPLTLRPNTVRLRVPYRSQLDGSPWASANCGPTTLGMALESLGQSVSSAQLRQEALDSQQVWGDDVGVYMEALADVAGRHGARVLDLYDGGALKRWSLDDIRRHVQTGHPVILQVWFPALPGRHDAAYFGDHYIVITGLSGDAFIYNDSIDSDGVGFDRLMTAPELLRAMQTSDQDYAFAGFALTLAGR